VQPYFDRCGAVQGSVRPGECAVGREEVADSAPFAELCQVRDLFLDVF
jgi:hypothetical protein